MLFKNLTTGLIWSVTNKDRIKDLLSDSNYEEVKETAKKEEAKQETVKKSTSKKAR